jgi:hypothetical protein
MHSSTGARSSGGRRSALRLVLAGGLFAGVLIGRSSTPSALQAPRPAGRLILQGDQRERLPPILRARGVKKIIVS